jgi:hypothetical protein
MPSVYLEQADYVTYGLDPTTDPSFIIQASAIINAFLDRPEGLIWQPDGNGDPCYMQGLAPSFVLTVTSGPIAASDPINTPVTVSVDGAIRTRLPIGAVLILDRANPEKTEAVIVSNIGINPDTVTLQNVQFDHDADSLMEFDLTIVEEIDMPDNRMECVLKKWPIASVITGQGQLGYPRRGSALRFTYNQLYSLLPPVVQYGGPPIWQTFVMSSNSYDPNTGRCWISSSIYLQYYTQVRMYYNSGWTYISLPAQIKQACANIATILSNSVGLLPIFKTIKQGDTSVTRFGNNPFANTQIDGDTQRMLAPYSTRRFI